MHISVVKEKDKGSEKLGALIQSVNIGSQQKRARKMRIYFPAGMEARRAETP
jgi:hypothetical protein